MITSLRHSKGFTFIEILVIVVLLSILFSLAAPEFKHHYDHGALSNETRTLTQFLRYAQYKAIGDGVPFMLSVNAEESSYQLLSQHTLEDQVDFLPLDSYWGKTIALAPKITFDRSSDNVIYFPDGSSSGGAITFRQDERRAQVNVHPGLGRIHVEFIHVG